MIEVVAAELAQQFASDNYAGICPEAWAAMERANRGHATSYGDDPGRRGPPMPFASLFETDCEVFFVFNGTAANSLALASLCQSYHSVICCDQRTWRPTSAARRSSSPTAPSCWWRPSADGKLTPRLHSELATKRRTSTIPSRAWSPSPNPRRRAASTRSKSSKRSPPPARRHGLLSAHGRRALCQRLRQPRPARPPNSPGSAASTCCASAAQRTAWRWARRCCSSTARWPRTSITAASRPASWPRRCVFSPRPGWACSRAARGCATPSTPTAAPATLPSAIAGIPGVTVASPVEANAVFLRGSGDDSRPRCSQRGWKLLHLHRRRGALHVRLGHRPGARRRPPARSGRVRPHLPHGQPPPLRPHPLARIRRIGQAERLADDGWPRCLAIGRLGYSGFDSAAYRIHAAEWLFPREGRKSHPPRPLDVDV